MNILQIFFLIIIGLAGGLAVGSGFVAFLTVLDIVPRLTQLIKGIAYIHWFQRALILGAIFFTWIDLREIVLEISGMTVILFGAFS